MSLNILVVDDSRTVRAVIVKALRLAKVPTGEVHQAENGELALQVVETNWIDLILTDINMPVMGGVELITNLKESPVTRDIPVVVISTEGSETRIAQLKELGVLGYIRKPFQPEDLRATINEIVGVRDE